MRENEYQAKLIRTLRKRFEGCVVLKNDSSYIQGIPDLTVLYKNRWGWLEVKESEDAPSQANQEYYIQLAQELSFGSFVFPENEEEVLDALQRSFEARRNARVSQR